MAKIFNPAVRALWAVSLVLCTSSAAIAADLDELFDELAASAPDEAPRIVEQIVVEWSKSGSPAMDFLMRQGQKAMDAEDYPKAIHHFTALTDHTPDFAAGWYALALAYFEQDRSGLALDALERVLAIEPRHFQAMEGLMVILHQSDLNEEAWQVANLIKALHPHYPDLDTFMDQLEQLNAGRDL